jgi:hypothetical protein
MDAIHQTFQLCPFSSAEQLRRRAIQPPSLELMQYLHTMSHVQ